jgi:hypothetical protein
MDTGSTAPAPERPARSLQDRPAAVRYPPDAASSAAELLAIVAYLTASDGPLQVSPEARFSLSPWHARLVRKAAERLAVIDAYMRARVAFLVAGSEHGYYAPQVELDLAGAALDACRATTPVVEALLEGRLPTRHEFDAMGAAALCVHPLLDALEETEGPHTR